MPVVHNCVHAPIKLMLIISCTLHLSTHQSCYLECMNPDGCRQLQPSSPTNCSHSFRTVDITTLILQHWVRPGSQMKAHWMIWSVAIIFSGRGHQQTPGVRFAIRTKLLQTLPESLVAISERLMTLRIPLAKHRYATFIRIYAPTLPSGDETIDHYYAMLWLTLMQVPRRDKLIVLGDFNTRIGSDSTIWANVMGKHGIGNINSSGHRLLNLCSEFGLFVTNTLFQLKHKHKTTWMHTWSKHWHLLDQGVPTKGTCIPGGTFAYPKGYTKG